MALTKARSLKHDLPVHGALLNEMCVCARQIWMSIVINMVELSIIVDMCSFTLAFDGMLGLSLAVDLAGCLTFTSWDPIALLSQQNVFRRLR